ncbi:type I restriction enzyme, S subunit [Flavobacterium fontis]|uniref:Type I restriction enzyme, S subunit n=1 Tax=Flavobacterium fontis TaxID=1124188 RepID=A0A1M4YMY9_9FLAO|nr:restriction endonuclease subunit S [Flavobacterium fontis]SHF07174.1 type I restriction enzyme, S subunit [Flavobacterium fontis]
MFQKRVNQMTKKINMTKYTYIPKLRFPNFKDQWAVKKMEELTERIGDGLHGTPIYSEDSDIFFINGNNLINGLISINENTKRVDNEVFILNDKKLNKNSILISINGTIGNVSRYNGEKVMLGKSVGYFKFYSNPDFYYHILNSNKIQNYFYSELTGSTIKNLSLKTLREAEICIPSEEEQTKIASFLTAVDDKLQALKKKKELLEQYKKGMMQQLFSQEIRFKKEDGTNYPDWEEKKLGNCLDYTQPTSYLVESTEYDNSYSIPVVTAGKTFILGYTNEEFGIYENGLPVIIFDDFTTASQFVDFPFKAKSSAMKILTAKESMNIKFVYEAMQMINFEIGGHGRHWISIYSELMIEVPCEEEQTKIANFLSAIDDKIAHCHSELDGLEQWKKGLLQQLFC